MLKLVFLGRLEDVAGAPERLVHPASDLAALILGLEPDLRDAVQATRVRIAVNGALVTGRDGVALSPGDEIAFLPPVSGG